MVKRSWFLLILLSVVIFGTPPSAARAEDLGPTCSDVVYTPPTASQPQQATLCLPGGDATRSSTAVVLVHGGGGFEGSRNDLRAWQQHYAAQGLVTLSIDYALLDDTDADGLYPLAEQNTTAAVQYVRLRGASLGIEHVVIQGHSAGARLAATVATTAGEETLQGPELWRGVSDVVDGLIGFYGYYGEFQFDADRYYGDEGSPLVPTERAQLTTGPALLVHGEEDTVIDVARSKELAVALVAHERSVQLEVVPDAGHGFDGYGEDALSPEGERLADLVDRWLAQMPNTTAGQAA